MGVPKKRSKTNVKKKGHPLPGEESRAVFSNALSIAKDLLTSKGLRIDLDQLGKIDLTIDSEKLADIPEDKFKDGLTTEYFVSLAATEFESLIEAATHSDPTHGVRKEIPSEILKKVGIDEFLWRFHQVEKELLPPALRERAVFKRTTQGFTLQNVNWQVVLKKHDQARGKLSDIPCGCLCISYDCPRANPPTIKFGAKGVSMELPTVADPKQLTLELHQTDVEELIETLTDLRDNLQKVKNGK